MRLEELINQHYDYLSETDLTIGKYVLENKNIIGQLGINEIAINSHASKSSVLRFAQKLGFSGYSDLKNYLKWREGNKIVSSSEKNLVEQIVFDVTKTLEYLSVVDLEPIFEAIENSRQIYVISTGVAQQNQAAELQRLFLLIDKPVQIIPGTVHANEYKRIIERLNEDDLLFLFSLSGENPNLQGILDIPELKGTKIISVTNFKSNWLSGHADFNLYASSMSNGSPNNWWVQSSSSFFIVIETLTFGFIEYQNQKKK